MFDELCIRPTIDVNNFESYQYATQIGNINTLLGPQSEKVKIAILTEGSENTSYQEFRSALYSLSSNFTSLELIDLGNIKGGTVGITEVVDRLQSKGILSIVISQDNLLPHTLVRSFSTNQNPINLSVIDSRIDYSWDKNKNYLADYLLPLYPKELSRLSWLGYHSYFVDPAVLLLLDKYHFEVERIGNLRSNIEEIEPTTRDSDIIAFDMSAIGYTDAPGTVRPNPNGFLANEVCQIMRYAGVCDRPSVIGLYGYKAENDQSAITALLLAQMVWYAIEGFYQRKGEFPPVVEQLIRYEVQLPVGQLPVAFFKSNRSERWWFYIGDMDLSSSELDPEHLFSCSYDDYLKACEGDLSNRLFNALHRFN